MNIRIAFLGFLKFREYLGNSIKRHVNIEIDYDIYEVAFDKVLHLAHDLEKSKYDVIVTGNTNASYLEGRTNLPIVKLQPSPLDVIYCLRESKSLGSKVGIAFFADIPHYVDEFEQILNMKIEKIVYTSHDDLLIKATAFKESGGDVLIGNSFTASLAIGMGIKGAFFMRDESIRESIDRAIEIIRVKRKEEEHAEQFKAILDYAHDGIIATDESGEIIFLNKSAEKIIDMEQESALGKKIYSLIPDLQDDPAFKEGTPMIDQLHQISSSQVIANHVPIQLNKKMQGMVSTFQDITKIRELERLIHEKVVVKGLVAKTRFEDLIGQSPSFIQAQEKAKKYAKSDSTILIFGETGSGKELFAQSIHNSSSRAHQPFVAINCGALPENLLESELFGYEEGAFTGARKQGKQGLFELAHRGTIFLDEIGLVSKNFQSRLLRILEEKEIIRIGSNKILPIDIRVISATNEDLRSAVANGTFRADLYYRLNILKLQIPPLRERKEDILLLINHFIDNLFKGDKRKLKGAVSKAIAPLLSYEFPGNVRELRNIIERFIILYEEKKDNDNEYLQNLLTECIKEISPNGALPQNPITFIPKGNYQQDMLEAERAVLMHYVNIFGSNKSDLAAHLGIARATLYTKLSRLKND